MTQCINYRPSFRLGEWDVRENKAAKLLQLLESCGEQSIFG